VEAAEEEAAVVAAVEAVEQPGQHRRQPFQLRPQHPQPQAVVVEAVVVEAEAVVVARQLPRQPEAGRPGRTRQEHRLPRSCLTMSQAGRFRCKWASK
jgi:hypothetical protein